MSLSMSNSSSSTSWNSFVFRILFKLGTVGTGFIAIVAGLLYAKQESLLYFPEINGIPRRSASNPRRLRSPSEYDIPFTSHMIKCSDGISIHAWLLHYRQRNDNTLKPVPTIIFFHGNAGNIGLRLPNAAQMYHNLRCNILMVEYRGYGDSDDVKPTEKGLKLDSEAAYHFIKSSLSNPELQSYTNIDPNQIFVFGRSLGGAVAFHLAKYAEQSIHQPIQGIIVENTFTSISKMVDALMPAIAPFKFLVLTIDWNSEKIAPTLHTPILYLAGDRDELVPHSQMKTLFHKSQRKGASLFAKMHIIQNGTHNESWAQGGKEYYNAIHSFISYVTLNSDGLMLQQQELRRTGLDGTGSTSCKTNTEHKHDYYRSSSLDATSVSVSSYATEITMGGGELSGTDMNSANADADADSGAIPIMPKTVVGIVKEASKFFASDSTTSDKKLKEI